MTNVDYYTDSDIEMMRSLIQRIATGPEMSKSIRREEAREGMKLILENRVSKIHAAIFLISLRMKRESDEENLGILEAFQQATTPYVAPTDLVVDIADPYDGYLRSLPSSPFLPAVLAACGVPTICHGLELVGPKFGVTTRRVLQEAGIEINLQPDKAIKRLEKPNIGWCYIDQQVLCPQLHDLIELRNLMVKRTCISTIENLTAPIRGRKTTHLLTGYVHKAYPRVYALLAQHAGYDGALIVRGSEGGVIPSLRQSATCFSYRRNGSLYEHRFNPADLAIASNTISVPLPKSLAKIQNQSDKLESIAKKAAHQGLQALESQPGPTKDSLIYGAATVLWHIGFNDSLTSAAEVARDAIDSEKAMNCFLGH